MISEFNICSLGAFLFHLFIIKSPKNINMYNLCFPSSSILINGYLPVFFPTDLSLSRQSLAASQFSAGGFGTGMAVNPNAFGMGAASAGLSRAASQRSDRRRQRSKSRDRAGSRLSHAGSTHSLTGYDTDNWTDHDMDIYVARNPTRGGLVQL